MPSKSSSQGYRVSRDAWTFVIFGIAILTAIASIVAIGLALRDDDDDDGRGSGAAAPIEASLSEFAISLSAGSIDVGGSIEVTNAGSQVHNLGVEGTDLITPDIEPGGSATLDLSSLEAGSYTLYCDIAGHADSGMTTPLVIGAAAGGDAAAAGGHEDHAAMTPEEAAALDQQMMDSMLAFPAETEGRGNQPLEPEVLEDGTKRFELTASIVDWEVRPGEVVQAWAYNGMVPGPRIDLDVGDKVEVEVTNELPLGTDVHWHGVDIPNGQDGVAPITQELIASGETYTYRFSVEETAVAMYHAHVHAQDAVPNGMFGTIFVGDMPLPAGQTISGPGDPGGHRDRPGLPDGAQRRRGDRLDTRRQELPGDGADRRRSKATGSRSATTTRGCRCTRCTSTASSRSSSPRTANRSTIPTPVPDDLHVDDFDGVDEAEQLRF